MEKKYRNIMVAIDGSNEAEQAFKEGVAIAKRNDSHFYIAHVSDTRSLRSFPNFVSPISNTEFMDQTQRAAETTLAEYKKWAEDRGLSNVKTILKFGSPKAEIAKNIPDEYDIDLILLGATGLNAVERILIGSVSEYVVRSAPCDVLIVRTYMKENEEDERIVDMDDL
ncbi:MAG TPA: universal stress protein [Atopostipes sp.]|nr:universal stress protein [Atopostipes sp.]